MGPFRLMDMIGIDICCRMAGHLHTEYGNRMRPAQLFRPLVEAGRVGEKVGAGFYDYPGGESEAVSELISVIRTPSEPPTRFCVERVMYPLINEAAYCVQERIATIPDIDLAMVAGTGMKFRGERIGPLAVADRIGLDAVLGALERLVQALGPRFRPARSLKMRVSAQHLGTASGKGFYEYP